jgi:tetratricopeptide (TPR) repeat protein
VAERRILDSWQEIADYLGRTVRTCQRYERELNLPVHRLDDSPKARVFAYSDELDAWREKRPIPRPGGFIKRLLASARARPVRAGIAAALGLALVTAVIFIVLLLSGRLRPHSALTIGVLPVGYASAVVSNPPWVSGLPSLLIEELSGSSYFRVLSWERTMAILHELGLGDVQQYSEAEVQAFANKTSATYVVTCVVTPADRGCVAVLAVLKPGSPEALTSRYEIAAETALGPTTKGMADRIKRDVGLTRTTQAGDFDALDVPVTTSSLEAFRLYNEGRRCHLNREYEKSIQYMRRAISRDRGFALAWRSLGVSLDALKKAREASRCFDKALELSRNASTQEQFFIKTCYFRHRAEFGLALQTSRQWMSLYPDDTQALLYHGLGCLLTEDPEEASRVLSAALGKGDRNPWTFHWAVIAATALGRFEEAGVIRENGLSSHPRNPLIAGTAVTIALAKGQLDRALSELNRQHGLFPGLGLDLEYGDILLLSGDFLAAEDRYIRAGRSLPEVKVRLARLALAQGRYGLADRLARAGGDPSLVAYVAGRQGRAADGIAVAGREPADEGASRSRSKLDGLLIKGALEVQRGDLEAAEATAARLGETNPDGLEKAKRRALKSLEGLIAAATEQPERAAAELDGAVGLLSRDVWDFKVMVDTQALTLYWAARQHESSGDTAKALEFFRRILGLNAGRLTHPDLYALSWFSIGKILEAEGNPEEARRSYLKFLDLWKNADPGLSEVEDAKARLAALTPR